MGHRTGQFDMAHPFAADLGQGDFDAALLADYAAVLQALVFAAQTFIVLDRAENLGAKQSIPFRFERSIVYGLRFLYLTEGP